jgi:hypothetical protein
MGDSLSKSQVARAGRTLRHWWQAGHVDILVPPTIEEAWSVLGAFRKRWSGRPLATVNMGLRSMVGSMGLGGTAEVTQP